LKCLQFVRLNQAYSTDLFASFHQPALVTGACSNWSNKTVLTLWYRSTLKHFFFCSHSGSICTHIGKSLIPNDKFLHVGINALVRVVWISRHAASLQHALSSTTTVDLRLFSCRILVFR